MKMIRQFIGLFLIVALMASCTDLDLEPIDDDAVTTANFFDSLQSYEQALAKIYAGLYMTGQQSPAGSGDIAGIDEGFSSYLRTFYLHQVLTTELGVIGFNDLTIQDFHDQDWGADDAFVRAMFSRFYYQITLCNAFIIEASGSSDEAIQEYVAEARFLRALSYWHALDLFRNIPLITEADGIGAFLPEQVTPEVLFEYIETELLEIEELLPEPGDGTRYPRADRGAVQMLLAKLYLNAEVYTGTARWDDAATYTNNVIGQAAYELDDNYDHLFLADNHSSPEIIFAVAHDGTQGGHFGGLNFIINAAIGGNMNNTDFGLPSGGWGGTRTTAAFVDMFEDDLTALNDGSFNENSAVDSRANFFIDGQSKEIEEIGTFTDGFAITKYKNLDQSGNAGSNGTFVDIDFPMFRLGDAYLMYAELALRNAAGTNLSTAVGYVNDLRERAYGNTSGNITVGDLSLDFILDERARELYWECHRRTDLVRFGVFTGGDYIWPWKGGVPEGTATSSIYDIFPIPSADLTANPNLVQNTGY
jgi:hypothetical protein